MKRPFALVLICLFWAALSGCASNSQQIKPSLGVTRFPSVPVQQEFPQEGSLFSSAYNPSLVSDFRARRVGDVVTIVVEEDLKGSKDVTTQTQRQSEMNIGLTGILGLDFKKRMEPRYEGTTIDATKAIGGSTTDKFQGTGKTSRNASLTGTISARVVQVLPGGNLLIQGSRELRINNETQYLILSGVVRPQDISPDNTISSTKIADARIEYTGGGMLSEKQRPAWFARLLGIIALF